jgi:hypothetical protein
LLWKKLHSKTGELVPLTQQSQQNFWAAGSHTNLTQSRSREKVNIAGDSSPYQIVCRAKTRSWVPSNVHELCMGEQKYLRLFLHDLITFTQ